MLFTFGLCPALFIATALLGPAAGPGVPAAAPGPLLAFPGAEGALHPQRVLRRFGGRAVRRARAAAASAFAFKQLGKNKQPLLFA
ncbi:hypothetical protein [Hymenobacter nivis]|uniref:Uncharacterized protein n=1 Tax=Hymenobacter nivis TaxID=1850093 RepID=A0A502H117_9BACT|nr:hypothetical protein [Hymenobacter nivis]TPG67372.1 hypothetical protein EAH73_06515 [Hymenobacter nivis]